MTFPTESLSPDHFARLRAAFHRLLDVDLAQRDAALRDLERHDPLFGDELRQLLQSMDETDLLASAERAPPRQLGAFRLQHRVGRGGMGDVFLAERVDGGFEQRVALKLVRDASLAPAMHRRFLRERQILARLVHPHIAYLVDGGRADDGRPWLAMEYVEGERITAWCDARQLDAASRVRLFLPVCDAVQFAHRNLVVHRDLKPANLLVDGEGRAKLLDFGIARLLDPEATDQTHTVAAMTPAYAAPEQRSGGEITTATDVFQLGVVLHELLCGALPDARPPVDATAATRAVHRAGLHPPRGDLARILAKAMAEKPSERYASVAMFADDLTDWLAARPLRSGIGRAGAQTRYLISRYRWPLALAAAVLVTSALGAAVAWQQARRAQEQTRVARSHLDALLDVLGSANSGQYAGREPSAGDFLVGAATVLRERAAQEPELMRRGSAEIAHALINLGRASDAEPLLVAALDAAARDAGADDDDLLVLLSLLMHAQDEPEAAARARVSAARIETLVLAGRVNAARSIDALARAGGVLSRVGSFVDAARLFDMAQARLATAAALPATDVENFWRQRGWAALRAHDADAALQSLQASQDVVDAHLDEFSALRRAEGEMLLAEAELASGRARAARTRFEAALPALSAEYGPAHAEAAAIAVQRARHALADGDASLAIEGLVRAEPILAAHLPAYARDFAVAAATQAQARAAIGDCLEAGAQLQRALRRFAALDPLLPRERFLLSGAQADVAVRCPP